MNYISIHLICAATLLSTILAQTSDNNNSLYNFSYLEREAEETCPVCETWNNAVVATTRRRKRAHPHQGRRALNDSKFNCGSKIDCGSKIQASTATNRNGISYITTVYKISSSGERILSNSKWVRPNQPDNWSVDQYQEWEEEAMAYLAYVNQDDVCLCSGFLNLVNFGMVFLVFLINV